MKKNNLYIGILYTVIGLLLVLLNGRLYSSLQGILFGFGFSMTIAGIVLSLKYFYWNRPSKIKEYHEKQKLQQIDMHDEFKNKLRNLSIRYTYIVELIILAFSIIIFSILGQLDIINNARIIVLYLGALLLIQLILSYFIYNYLLNKYIE